MEVLDEGFLGMGRFVGDLESAVLEAIGSPPRHAAVVSTGHAALHLAMVIAGIGPGDEVITPSFTHLSDIQAILNVGARPVFCDADPITACIDPERAAELIGPNTRAIIAMDYGCFVCDHDAFAALAAQHGLRLIHDAAHAFGSSYRGKAVGTFSDICMFSFDPVKALTAVDCGVLVVKSDAELAHIQRLRLLGSDQPPTTMYKNARTWDYDAVHEGFRYHVSNLHAAIGIAQVKKLDRIRSTRQASCRVYSERLKEIDGVQIPASDFEDVNPFLYAVRIAGGRRDDLRAFLAEGGVDTGMHWRPAHRHTYFSQFRAGPLPVTERLGDEIVSLPLHSCMDDTTVHRVCDGLEAFFSS